jgi:hypothetical protein
MIDAITIIGLMAASFTTIALFPHLLFCKHFMKKHREHEPAYFLPLRCIEKSWTYIPMFFRVHVLSPIIESSVLFGYCKRSDCVNCFSFYNEFAL